MYIAATENIVADKDVTPHYARAYTTSLWLRARTWVLLLPLLYFGTDGQILSWHRVEQGDVGGLSTTQVVIGLFLWLLAVLVMLPAYRYVLKAWRRNWALSAFVVYAVLSAFWSPDLAGSLRKAIFLSIVVSLGYFLGEKYPPEEQMRLIFATGCLVVFGSYMMLAINHSRAVDNQGDWVGLFGHKNSLSMTLCLDLMPFFFISRKNIYFRLLGYSVIILGLVAILLSQSRTGWITCAFSIAYICFAAVVRKFKTLDAVAIIVVVLTSIGLVGWIAAQNFSSVTRLLGKDSTLTGRTEIWHNAFWALSKHLFWGYGYAGFWNGLTSESNAVNVQLSTSLAGDQHFTHAHNALLTMALQVGIVGIAIFLVALGIALRNGFRLSIQAHSREALWYFSILLTLCVAGTDESTFMEYLRFMTPMFALACAGLQNMQDSIVNNELKLS